MKISTKTGDGGETSLFGGRRVRKSCDHIEVLGELDELQSMIGWAICGLKGQCEGTMMLKMDLERVQDDIYRIMSLVGFEMKCPKNIEPVSEKDVQFLERMMSKYEKIMEDLSKFIRPGSCEEAARFQVARAVCRRAERRLVSFSEEVEGAEMVMKYVNRLSDLLFVVAFSFEIKGY